MFAPYRSNAVAYRQLGVETAMADATPHKLIAMLFDGADEHIRKGASAMARADHATTRVEAGDRIELVTFVGGG